MDVMVFRPDEDLSTMSLADLIQELSCALAVLQERYSMDVLSQILALQSELRVLHGLAAFQASDKTLYCVCQRNVHPDRVMVQCDRCMNWLHPTCLGFNHNVLKEEEPFICSPCQGKRTVWSTLANIIDKYMPENKMNESQLVQELTHVQERLMDVERELNQIDRITPGTIKFSWHEDGDLRTLRFPWHILPHVPGLKRSPLRCVKCQDPEGGLVVCCDSCPRLFHPKCLTPPVEDPKVLPDPWYCEYCRATRSS